jgi:Tfp pilus assembly protein PilZ
MQSEQRANYILDGHLAVARPVLHSRRANAERRAKPRSSEALPARVWGVDIEDQPFSFDCHIDNISASGVYVRIPRRMRFSSAVSLVVQLLNGPAEGVAAAIKGIVIRDDTESDGHRGVGIRIIEHQFI